MLNIIIFGPPGAGKGTQSLKLMEKYNLVHLSTGNILRGEVASQTALGIQAKALMDKGILVSDDIVIGMIGDKISSNLHSRGFIYDGFPRTLPQAVALDKLMAQYNLTITVILSLEVEEEELFKRISKRGIDSGREDDRSYEVFQKRMEVYNLETKPLKEFYTRQGKLKTIIGFGGVENVFNMLCEEIYKVNVI